ncbi:redox-sensing transcriptional repressor Rex [Pseudoflavonifractor phocaeensis]|uniref:redox-sensing transcriptional repressor Rex n=1 Tax=Pseudoflavonifractor phocaeensis TaxID=1870988 RepID=UPI001F01F675|nr:redox-sensing transcriptional repressor Rex [Pseudoflavonifractor phocaeensis]MCF2661363.1 redox-sensing transcriptional repressor Rex [Pseudoflavonifractor phocaeensis]
MKRNSKVSTAVIRRLPRYYRQLSELQEAGTVRISSSALGKSMGLTASQIRQDLFCFGGFGQQGYGYKVDSLKEEIGEILGINQGHTIVVLGTGNLGRALIRNFKFSSNGFRLLAAFDISAQVVGTQIAGVPVYHTDSLESFLAEHPVDVGLLTVPISAAQEMGDRLVAAGVRGIWNFTNCEISVSRPEVVVESVHFSDSLLALSYMISREETGGDKEELS